MAVANASSSSVQEVVRPVALVPAPGRLAQVVAQARAVNVLSLPADEAGPIGEQGFMDDLDAASWFTFLFADLV
jgi:hypothetical protein